MNRMTAALHSEPFQATGGIAAAGVRNALGRPSLELATLLLRETVQNSWDARDPDFAGPVLYGAHHRILKGRQAGVLRDDLFYELPPHGLDLDTVLGHGEIPVLVIFDRGTIGLAGPTRADLANSGPANFVNFIHNVGYVEQRKLGGGTYGYGKSVLYRASAASTILVHTHCLTEQARESRLIAGALGDSYDDRGYRYTGRHWWGVADKNAGVEPITGDEADEIAAELGLPPFETGELGTTIAIIGAEVGESASACMHEMACAALWHCWPKMVDLGRGVDMTFDIRLNGAALPVLDPESHPELKNFVAALRDVMAIRAEEKSANQFVYDIRCERPKQLLGHMALRVYSLDRASLDSDGARPFQPPSHHVALLRHPRLVVTYLDGPELPVPGMAWASVFHAWDDVDSAFARAEPPSHDGWVYQTLPKGTDKSFVKVALTRIGEVASLFGRIPDPEGGENLPLGRLADSLGDLLVYGSGTSVSRMNGDVDWPGGDGGTGGGSPTGGGGARRVRIDVSSETLLVEHRGQPALQVPFTVRLPGEDAVAFVEVDVAVAVNDGTSLEREPPAGAEVPRVLGWIANGETIGPSGTLKLTGAMLQECSCLVSVPPDAAVVVDFRIRTAS